MSARAAAIPLVTVLLLDCDRSPPVDADPDPGRAAASGVAVVESAAPTAAASAPSSAAPSESAATGRNALFLALFRRRLPDDLCQPQQYFRACFRVSEQRCKEVVSEELGRCEARHAAALPLVRDATTGAEAGRVLGQCAGAAYDVRLLADRISSAACNDPTRWTGK